MNKKHQQAFRELREWCKRHGIHFYAGSEDHIFFQVGHEDRSSCYCISGLFDEKVEVLLEPHYINHSISSEAEDE